MACNRFLSVSLRLLVILILLLFVAGPGRGDTLLNIGGSRNATAVLLESETFVSWLGMSFSFDKTYEDVGVTANFYSYVPGKIFLTNAVGAGTTASNVIASESFDSMGYEPHTFFGDLKLNAGTYFFLVTVNGGEGGWSWLWPLSIYEAPGVTYNGYYYASLYKGVDLDFPPASVWRIDSPGRDASLEFSVSGLAVPEPSLMVLLGISVTSLVGLRRWWRD